jgi:putative NADPH-quinone reductase
MTSNLVTVEAVLKAGHGIKKEDYSKEGRYRYTVEHILSPFETTFQYCNAEYHPFFAFHGTENEPDEIEPGTEIEASASELEKSALNYLDFIDNL